MSASTILAIETRLVTTQLDLSCVCVIEALLVMDLIVQVCLTNTGIYCHEISIPDKHSSPSSPKFHLQFHL